MSRQGKPYLYRGWWGTKSGGKFTKLAPEGTPPKTVKQLFLAHALKLAEERPIQKPATALLAWEVVEKFADFTKANRSEGTFEFYKPHLQDWIDRVGKRLASSLTADDLETWKQELVRKGDSPAYINHRIVTVNTCWNYAVKIELLPRNPFRVVEKLFETGRQRTITPQEFRALLRHSTDAEWKQFLVAMRLTGSRPSEMRYLTWDMVKWEHSVLVIQKHKTQRTTKNPKPRIIPMTEPVYKLLRYRQRVAGDQPFCFLNSEGQPWTKDAVVQRMDSNRLRAGIGKDGNGENLVLYSNRHSFGTDGGDRLNEFQIMQVMGHTSTRTTARYVHPAYASMVAASTAATKGTLSAKG